jgi:molybdenum cofactor cytidylyltransferase
MPDEARPDRVGAIILAAGGSTRMGRPKQLLEIGGLPLVARAVDVALASGARPVAVVVGADADRVLAAVADREILAVHNPDWKSGLSSSIRAGLAALLKAEPALDAVLVAPCDQPALSAAIIGLLAANHRSTGLISAARFGGRNGAPAIFGRSHFSALAGLSGDEGARRMLNSIPGIVSPTEIPELGTDLDTPADYEAWLVRVTRA